MAAIPDPVSILLADLMRRGIELRPAPGGLLRYRPRSAMTPDLAARLAMYRDNVRAALAAGPDAVPDWTAEERRRLAGCPPRVVELVETAKAVFAPLGGVEVVDVRPFKSEARDDAARLIREARARPDREAAVAMRDAWRERLAICTVDGELSIREAEAVALDELQGLVAL